VFDMIRLGCLIKCAYHLNPDIKIGRQYVSRDELKQLFGYSVWVFCIVVSRQIVFLTDSIVIGIFMTTSAITVYFIAGRLTGYLRLLISEMIGVLMPTTSDLNARNDQAGIQELLVTSTKYMLLIALPVCAVFIVLGGDFVMLWMGPGYSLSVT